MNHNASILIACESFGVLRRAFTEAGFSRTWSCDLLDADDNSDHHFIMDIRDLLSIDNEWDLMIAHPPCTYLSVSGIHWNHRIPGRSEKTEEALEFVRFLMEQDIPRIAIENPVGVISTRIRKPDQIIQPYDFGDDASKKTCLWLRNLPVLEPTTHIPGKYACPCGYRFEQSLGKYGCPNCNGESGTPKRLVWANQTNSGQNRLGPSETRWQERSKTYQGIADAIVDQWGKLL